MEMNDKESCLSDIEKALEIMDGSNFSHELQSIRIKLIERKSRCKNDETEKHDNEHGFFSMKNPSQTIEAAENFIEIQVTIFAYAMNKVILHEFL
jgi:hypothetical protein